VRRTLGVALLIAGASAGCTGSSDKGDPVPAVVLTNLTTSIEALEQARPERLPAFFVQALQESELLAPACAKAIDQFNHVNPAERQLVAARAYVTCGFGCPSRTAFATFGELPPAGRAALIGRDCNHGIPDPLFGTDEAARLRAPVADYLVVRFLLETARARFAADRSARATALWRRHEALVPQLASGLASAGADR